MDTRWLQDFLTLAEVGNFTRAAQLCHSSQAAFSRRIQSLENWLGTKLIDRSRYPLYLTPEGEIFRRKAEGILSQVEEARAIAPPSCEQQLVRIALPYTLAVSRLPAWWRAWCNDPRWVCQARTGNVLDTTESFAAGAADILISYYQPAQRLPLEIAGYDRVILSSEVVAPYGTEKLLGRRGFVFPGTEARPVPYFHYTREAYFHRLVEDILRNARVTFHGKMLGESGMSEVLMSFATEDLGVAWLADSCVRYEPLHRLVNLDNTGIWSLKVDIIAFVAKLDAPESHIGKLWRRIKAGAVDGRPGTR